MMNYSMFISPVILVLVEAVKRMEILDKRWLPITALAIGIVAGTIFAVIQPEKAVEHIVNGLLYGGASAGIYDAMASALDI